MKKTTIGLSTALLLLLTLSACNKWVDYNPREDFLVTDLDFLRSEADYRTMAVSVYTPLQWMNQQVPVADIASDNSVAGGETASDILSLQQIDDFTHTPVNSTLAELWQSAYEGINRANYLHQFRDRNPSNVTVDFAGKTALYGEIYFLRAYYYFQLVRMFGDVPLFVDRRLALTDSRTLTRAPKADVYKAIEADLTTAIAALPAVQVQRGRITKYAAQALLGKVLIYQNKFDAAAPVLESIINSNAFTLVPNFASIFLASGENGPESVFEIQYSNSSPYFNWGAVNRGQGNHSVQQNGVRGISGTADMPYAPGWSTNLPTQNLAAAYDNADQRKAATCFDVEAYRLANPQLNVTYQVAPYKNTGLYNHKYLPRKGETSGQIELNYLNNFRTIRYAEVLLMAAEALNRSTAANDARALQYLNQVRERAFGNNTRNISASGAALRQAIWDERRLELAMEGDRFFDLVRTGQAATRMQAFRAGKHEVFPIPFQEISVSGLSQNPGY